MQNNNQDKELTRYPQSLNYTPTILNDIFGEEADLIRDIAIFGSVNYNRTLFDTTRLTIEDFVKMGYSRYSLQRVADKFKHLSKSDIKKAIAERRILLDKYKIGELSVMPEDNPELPFLHDHLCISKLDYAFYKASKMNLSVSKKDNDRIVSNRINVLRDDVSISNVSQKDKRVYEYQLSSAWVELLYKAYHLIDFRDYLALSLNNKSDRAGDLRSFYLYLGRMISIVQNKVKKGEEPTYQTTVDEICKITTCNLSVPAERKRFVTGLLNDILALVKNSSFEWEYFSTTNQRAKYHVRFIFSKEVLGSFDEGKKAVYNKALYEEAFKLFKGKIMKKDIANINMTDIESKFIDWYISNEDIEEKKELQLKVYNQIYQKIHIGGASDKPKRHYISRDTLLSMATLNNKSLEIFAKTNGYIKDEKGEYYKLQ